MKKEFFGFYDPTKEEIESAWTDGVFVFDANALLNLYRYSESTREDFFKALDNLAEKLFMPYQVGFEFHSNKISVIKSLESLFDSLPISVDEILKPGGPFDSIFHLAKRHPSIEIEAFKKLKAKFIQSIKEELDSQKSSHPDFSKEDTVLDSLTKLYEGKVGKAFSEEQLQKIYQEGESRYSKKIPPGFKDLETKKDKGNQRLYGDLIIWKQLIEYGKEKKKPIILITDDRKEDWWTKEGGETIRPRQELIKEFYDQTGIRILIYAADRFLKFAKERGLIHGVTEESITEVQDVRKDDEAMNKQYVTINSYTQNPIPAFIGTSGNKNAYVAFNPNQIIGNYPTFGHLTNVDEYGNIIMNTHKPSYSIFDAGNRISVGDPSNYSRYSFLSNESEPNAIFRVSSVQKSNIETPLPEIEDEAIKTESEKIEPKKNNQGKNK